MDKIKLTPTNRIGTYAHDSEGNSWCTAEFIGHTGPCTQCGKQIQRGWVKGRLGEQREQYCLEHIEVDANENA